MSDHHHHSNGSGFLNGLLIGAIIGAGIAFFLQTKRGKEIGKELSEKAFSLLENFDELVSELEENTASETPSLPSEIPQEPASTQSPAEQKQVPSYLAVAEDITTKPATVPTIESTPRVPTHLENLRAHHPRRLFRGIPKRG